MKKKLLDSKDLIIAEHWVMKDLVNFCYLTKSYRNVLKYLSNGVGFGTDAGGFTFWSDLDEYDKSFYSQEFKGVEVEFGDESEIIDYKTLYYYLDLATQKYIEKYPEDEQEFEKYLNNIKFKVEE